MAGKIIWLMCYISLGLALTLGNHPGSHYPHTQIRSSGHDHRLRNVDQSIDDANKKYSSESDSSSRFDEEPYDLPPDWNLYDDRHFTRDFIDNRLNDNSRDYINNNNNKNNINKGLVNKLTASAMDNTDTHRDLKSKERHSNHGGSDSNNNNKRGLRDSDEMSSGHSRSSGSGSGNSGSIRNQYDLNGRSMERRDNLVGGRSSSLKSSSSVWSLEPNVVVDYPWKIQQANGDMRLPAGNTYARTLGKRNQVAGGRRKPVESRSTSQQGQPPPFLGSSIPEVAMGSMASQLMLRTARGNRQYDVPQIECPSSEDGMERFACPTPDRMGRYRCIDDHVLCDGFIDCPTGEDEDRQACMFYKTTKAHLDVLAEALLRWVRGR
ncbi:uncharacterized protein LOC130666761 [Microplitis mediator]|uniref:uncharacterized protein LOC130666761 n=1 Tax=Microplitis mediator TaxID=375433 RepID=UPI00255285AB|nr:uncharacterized protein LOC130666761 [Microplitis mediator]